MKRLRAWLRRFDRLTVQPSLWLPGSETVAITPQRGWLRLLTMIGASATFGLLIVLIARDEPLGLLPILGGIFTVGARAVDRRPTQLRNPALAQAAAWAAVTVGKKSGEKWIITGVVAAEVGAELARLQALADTLRTSGGLDPRGVEQELLASATSVVRPYLRPVLTAAPELEPREVDAIAHRDGDPWPMLERAEMDWPVLWNGEKTSA